MTREQVGRVLGDGVAPELADQRRRPGAVGGAARGRGLQQPAGEEVVVEAAVECGPSGHPAAEVEEAEFRVVAAEASIEIEPRFESRDELLLGAASGTEHRVQEDEARGGRPVDLGCEARGLGGINAETRVAISQPRAAKPGGGAAGLRAPQPEADSEFEGQAAAGEGLQLGGVLEDGDRAAVFLPEIHQVLRVVAARPLEAVREHDAVFRQ